MSLDVLKAVLDAADEECEWAKMGDAEIDWAHVAEMGVVAMDEFGYPAVEFILYDDEKLVETPDGPVWVHSDELSDEKAPKMAQEVLTDPAALQELLDRYDAEVEEICESHGEANAWPEGWPFSFRLGSEEPDETEQYAWA